MVKKKMPFIKLAVLFSLITVLVLYYKWGSTTNDEADKSMMDLNMGDMMGEMHLNEITVSDLFVQEKEMVTVSSGDTYMESHHQDKSGFIVIAHKITTLIIVILLPFILAGSIFLAIIWFGP